MLAPHQSFGAGAHGRDSLGSFGLGFSGEPSVQRGYLLAVLTLSVAGGGYGGARESMTDMLAAMFPDQIGRGRAGTPTGTPPSLPSASGASSGPIGAGLGSALMPGGGASGRASAVMRLPGTTSGALMTNVQVRASNCASAQLMM
jgi:hypothetical protein